MDKYNIEELDKRIKSMLSEKRYKHSLNVAKLAKELASYHFVDEQKAYIAGLLHDITKEFNESWQDECLIKHDDTVKLSAPRKIKHSYTAKYYLQDELNIDDEDILDAVYNHTICMSDKKLSKIIYIADKREEGRKLDNKAVELAKRDLDEGYKEVFNDVSKYLELKKYVEKTNNNGNNPF